ncbi:hypothetical protein LVJ83_00560 [Uruburuella testudinis]|uniref:Phage holin family protein n=1 Tax=Uruburuella testudinis TaxID=1282863 RepID=A0ABY4DTI3_9NEIS|nr:hypothetical protein [Uruburuella testudinis]UOO82004.1 hypothetical protein LVJ83_00560 [Uruburuella testudinis]
MMIDVYDFFQIVYDVLQIILRPFVSEVPAVTLTAWALLIYFLRISVSADNTVLKTIRCIALFLLSVFGVVISAIWTILVVQIIFGMVILGVWPELGNIIKFFGLLRLLSTPTGIILGWVAAGLTLKIRLLIKH